MTFVNQKYSFGCIVDAIYGLPLEERLELKNLLEHNIIEARRAEENEELTFSDNIETLRKML
jgi:hypothetical protein